LYVGRGQGGDDFGTLDITTGAYTEINSNPDINSIGGFAFAESCSVPVVGGEFLLIDNTALLVAGLQSSAIWMLPALTGAAGTAFGILFFKVRRN